jgi:hypothetical protein
MGIYRCEKADPEAIVLRHEGEDDHTIEVHAGIAGAAGSGAFAPVPAFYLSQIKAGKRYIVSQTFSEFIEPAAEPAPASPEQPEQAFDAPEASDSAPAASEAPSPSAALGEADETDAS